MKLRLKKDEVELVTAVLSERISIMKHAGYSYIDLLKYKITHEKILYQFKKQVRSKKDSQRVRNIRQQGRVHAIPATASDAEGRTDNRTYKAGTV